MNSPRRHRRHWSTEETTRLVQMIRTGMTVDEAADVLGRSPGSVRYKALQQGCLERTERPVISTGGLWLPADSATSAIDE